MARSARRSLSPWHFMWLPPPALQVRSPLFRQGFFRHFVLKQRIGQQPFESSVLGFQLFEAFGIGHVHTANFCAKDSLRNRAAGTAQLPASPFQLPTRSQ